MSDIFKVFSTMENESNKLEGVVSILYAVADAINYSSSDPKDFAAAIELAASTLQDFSIKHEELIEQGCQLTKENKLEAVK
jgi:hypothetical protein